MVEPGLGKTVAQVRFLYFAPFLFPGKYLNKGELQIVWYRFATKKAKLNINLPDYAYDIMSDIKAIGGRALVVGGAVRDAILGHSPKDIDFEVYNTSYEDLNTILSKYGRADLVGQSFGVIKFLGRDGSDFDFSLPRLDSKAGVGHKDFNVEVRSDLTPEEAASRRDFTINAISYDPITGEIIDPYNGQTDLKNKILRHTSDAFAEDPLRTLRGMQFASRFGFDLAPETAELMRSIKDQYAHLPKERVEAEFKKLVLKGIEPGKALEFLYNTGWSENFPHIHNLKGVPQDPEFHPEGWSFTVVPPDSFRTGMAKAHPINLLTREFLLSSIANSTGGKSTNVTASTKFSVQSRVLNGNLPSTSHTGISDFIFPPAIFSPTSVTPAEGFMGGTRVAAEQASKIIGVVFKVPLSSVLTIMESAVNNNEIIQGIIKSVSIYVMNVLSRKKSSAQVQLHDISVQKHGSRFSSGNTNFSVASGIIDPKFSVIDSNVIFYFYLSGIGDVDIHTNNIGDSDLHILVNVGDVATHTAHVMNAAAKIADREGLTGEDREVLIYAALAHDFAKPATTKVINKKGVDRITSHGHEEAGGPMAREFLTSIGVNSKIINKVVPLVENHLNHIHHSNTTKPDSFVRQLAERLHPANIQELERLIEADHSGRPPLPAGLPEQAKNMSDYAKRHNVYTGKHPNLLQGADVIKYTGGQGSPLVGHVLNEHRKLILENHPSMLDRNSALSWLDNRMQKHSSLINGNDVMSIMGVKGADIKPILERAWVAQKNGEFSDKESAINWLKNQGGSTRESFNLVSFLKARV